MCQINRGRSCLDGSQPWTHALALPGGMFVLLLENLEWFGWEKTEGRLIVVVWDLFKGIQVLVGPRQFSWRQQSVRDEAPHHRRHGLKDISLDFPSEFLITLIQNFTQLSHKQNISFVLFPGPAFCWSPDKCPI